jgi:hypothetical protein
MLYEMGKTSDPVSQKLRNTDGSLKLYSCVTYPDGSLRTSIDDLSHYLAEMMKTYQGNSSVLGKEASQVLFSPQFRSETMPQNMDPKEPNRAIFWAYNRKGKITHTGSDYGVFAYVAFHPLRKVGRVILMNTQIEGEENEMLVEGVKRIMRALDDFEEQLK